MGGTPVSVSAAELYACFGTASAPMLGEVRAASSPKPAATLAATPVCRTRRRDVLCDNIFMQDLLGERPLGR